MSHCPGAGVVNSTCPTPSLYDLEQATLPSILTWGQWKRGEWVSPKSSGVVTACYRRPFQEPSISPGIPSEAIFSKGGGVCQVLGHCWVLGSSQVRPCQEEPRKIGP